MVVIKVEMWPQGQSAKSYSLGTLTLALDPDTKPTDTRRNYTWRLTGRKGITLKSGRVEGHTPKSRGVWDLILRTLQNAYGYRNPIPRAAVEAAATPDQGE
jgi:hypothetical protein